MATTDTDDRPEPKVTLGDLIRRARVDAGFDQSELAARIGSKPPTVSAWERDRSQPDFGWIKRIVKECNAPWLFTEPFKNEVRTRTGWSEATAGQGSYRAAA